MNSQRAFDKYGAIKVDWGKPIFYKNDPVFKSIDSFPHRSYSYINLTGNDEDDNVRLDNAQLQIRNLIKSQDTTSGVCFIFNTTSKYGALVKALDICRIENAYAYVSYDNAIYVTNITRDVIDEERARTVLCGRGLGSPVIVVKSDEQIEKEIKERIWLIVDMSKTFIVSVILYFIMMLLTVKRSLLP